MLLNGSWKSILVVWPDEAPTMQYSSVLSTIRNCRSRQTSPSDFIRAGDTTDIMVSAFVLQALPHNCREHAPSVINMKLQLKEDTAKLLPMLGFVHGFVMVASKSSMLVWMMTTRGEVYEKFKCRLILCPRLVVCKPNWWTKWTNEQRIGKNFESLWWTIRFFHYWCIQFERNFEQSNLMSRMAIDV